MPEFQEIAHQIVVLAVPILLAVTFHEVAHGYVADRLGDPTARRAGRLTLNPLVHLDLTGTLVFVVTRMIGWAKPVPVNAGNFRNPRRGMLWVSLAGPGANLALAVVLAAVFHGLAALPVVAESWFAARVLDPLLQMAEAGVLVNLGLGLFNLVPIPPLDGSRVLAGLLPAAGARAIAAGERYGFLLLLVLVFSGALRWTVYPPLYAAARLLLG
ncbi:MAG: site-2 protease family protein [Deferrisomatales bacterium]|nr:site-2 protease family protein [Deferrisomatales bacterium]